MSYAPPPDEVAEDFGQALRDMGPMNSRYEISNLTVIAKENTEHALAISEALKSHIKQTSPQKKLPAFYVLDSIVKNVGTPYTLFFGRQLYQTFMEAYALVDMATRKKMDEMLKTWKEPVPGSIDVRPVFPPEVTRPIETALIKARTSAIQAQQEQFRGQQAFPGRGQPINRIAQAQAGAFRNTPTPPQGPPGVGTSAMQGAPGYGQNYNQPQYPPQTFPSPANGQQPLVHGLPPRPQTQHFPQQYPPHQQQMQQQYPPQYPPQGQQYSQAPPQQYAQQYPVQGQYPAHAQQYPQYPQPLNQEYAQQYTQEYPPRQMVQQTQNGSPWISQEVGTATVSLDTLKRDIAACIALYKTAFSRDPHDATTQAKLKVLLDLQIAMINQQPVPEQLAAVRAHVDELFREAQGAQGTPRSQAPSSYFSPPPPAPAAPVAPVTVVPVVPVASAPPPAQPLSLNSLFGSSGMSGLAALLARQSATPQPTPPPQSASVVVPPPQIRPSQQVYSQGATPGTNSAAVSDTTALLERLRASGVLSSVITTPSSQSAAPTARIAAGFPPSLTNTPPTSGTPMGSMPNDVVLKSVSLKIPRPHLIDRLYFSHGPSCTQCGRRFRGDAEGRAKKTAHMDWHFRVSIRLNESKENNSVQNRSWYMDELEWIKAHEGDDEDKTTTTESQNGTTELTKSAKPQRRPYILAPLGDAEESFNKVCPICQEKFETSFVDDEFIWDDARQVGDRVYHASCYEEVSKDEIKLAKRGTPEPVLGKRKAEDEHMAMRTKIRTEP